MTKKLLALALLSTLATPAFAQSDHDRIAALEAQVRALQAEIQAMKGNASAAAVPAAHTDDSDLDGHRDSK